MHSTVPGTYVYTTESWNNKSWGFYDLDRKIERGIVRIGADGSRATTIEHRSYRKYLFLTDAWSLDTLYRGSEHLAYVVDPKARKIGVIRCFDSESFCSPVRLDTAHDVECAQAANRSIPGGHFIGLGKTADLRTARYKFNSGPLNIAGLHIGPYTYEIALAPDLGCEVVESKHVTYNSVGLPTDYIHFVTRSFSRQIPRPEAFAIPNGYEVWPGYLPAWLHPPVE